MGTPFDFVSLLDRKLCTAVGAGLLLLLGACASGPGVDPAAWIDSRQHPQYPNELYLIGVGTSVNADREVAYQQARDRAIADIAGQLETHIQSEVTTFVQESIRMEGGDTESSLMSDVSSSVKAVTAGTLKSIQPVTQHYDEARSLGASLVAIKRSDFGRQARQELAELDDKVTAQIAEADALAAEKKLFQAVRGYGEVEPLLLRRAAVQAQANFVLPGAAAAEPAATLGELFSMRRAAARQVELILLCAHDEFGREGATAPIERLLVSEFSALGIGVRPGPRTVDGVAVVERWNDTAFLKDAFGGGDGQPLLLLCEVTTTSRGAGHEDMISVRSSGTARLLDANSGQLLLTESYSPDSAGHAPAIGEPSRQSTLIDQALGQLAEHLARRVLGRI